MTTVILNYPTYVKNPKNKKNIIETWYEGASNKNMFMIIIGVIVGLVLIAIVVGFFAARGSSSNCKDAFCKVSETVQNKINSKVIMK
jgi:hypothetical protein